MGWALAASVIQGGLSYFNGMEAGNADIRNQSVKKICKYVLVLMLTLDLDETCSPFFLPVLNFFQLSALMNIECFFRFFSSALFSTSR